MRRFLAHWRLLASALVVALLVGAAFWPAAVEVDFARATRQPLRVTVDDEGETRVRERFVVSAPVAGRLQRIALQPGDRVTRGETVLARLTPLAPALLDARARAELTAAVEAARALARQAGAEHRRALVALQRTRSQAQRQQELVDIGAISRDEFEATQSSVQAAEASASAAAFNLARADYDLQLAQARLQAPTERGADARPIVITAPLDGVVLKRLKESETVVGPGEPLLEIGDPQRLEIVADLLSSDAVRVTPGSRVMIDQWGGGQTLDGRVRLVEPSGFMKVSALGVEEQRVNVVIDFVDVHAAGALGDGYRVEVRIVVWEEANTLTVPVAALFRQGDAWAVFTVTDDRIHAQPIVLGPRNATDAQVTEGLQDGQTVIVHPPDTLRDGGRVTARPTR